jgi:O-antigen/teichoic acid export membrane protein
MDKQKIKVDLILATGTSFFAKLVGYIIITILVRYLTKDEMGAFFFAATLATIFALISTLGTNQYLIREVSEKPEGSITHLSQVLSLRLLLQVLLLLILNCFVLLTTPDIILTVFLTSIYIFLDHLYYSFGSYFLGLRQVIYWAITQISTKLLLAVLVIFSVNFNASLILILLCYILANTFLILLSALLVWVKYGPLRLSWNRDIMLGIARISLPFFILSFLIMVQLNIDTLMLGYMKSYSVVATYTAGIKLLEASQFVIRPIPMIFFPITAGLLLHQNWAGAKSLFQKLLLVTGSFGLLVSVGVLLTAHPIIMFVFGPDYSETVGVVRVLFLGAPFLYTGLVCIFYANALHIEKKAVWVMLIGVTGNIILSAIAISWIGAIGAAWATVVSQGFITITLLSLDFRYLLAGKPPSEPQTQQVIAFEE